MLFLFCSNYSILIKRLILKLIEQSTVTLPIQYPSPYQLPTAYANHLALVYKMVPRLFYSSLQLCPSSKQGSVGGLLYSQSK